MRIGIEAQRIFRPKKHGMDMVALEVIRNLQRLDTENEYIVFVKEDEDVCLEESANVRIETFGGPYPVWEQWHLPRRASEAGVDLLHCTSNTAPIRCSVPLVLTLHDIIYLEKNNLTAKGFTWYQKLGNVYRKWVVPQVLSRCERIITVSEFERERISEKLGLPADKLVAVYNGVGTHFRVITDEQVLQAARKQYHLPERYFFFLGNTDPKKNTPNVLRAYLQYCRETTDPIHLLIVDYPRERVVQFLEANQASEWLDKFHFPGYVKNTDLPAILNQAEVMLYPSLRESFGIPQLEGMACGAPVITSTTSSMPEVSGGAALLIDPYKPAELAEAMKRLLRDTELREQLVQKGLERARQFSWEQTALQTLDVYRSIQSPTA